MPWFARKTAAENSGTGSGLAARMPAVKEPSKTQQYADLARQQRPANEHWSQTQVFSYLELLRGRYDAPLYAGVAGRPAILLGLSGRFRADLDGLGDLIGRSGGSLFLSGQRLGRYGMIRAVLELPEPDLIFETPLTLAHGDVQEFLSAAYQNEAIELHLAHTADKRTLAISCHAAGIRPVADVVLQAVRGMKHPHSPAEQKRPVAELEKRFPKIDAGLTSQTQVRLTVTGQADSVVKVTTIN